MGQEREPTPSTESQIAAQKRLWDHVQVEHPEMFNGSEGRIRYLARQVGRTEVVLNIGIGQGNLEALFLQRKVDFFSLDPSEIAVEILGERLGIDPSEKGRLRVGYAHHIPFASGSFDVVVLSEVLEHIPTEKLQGSLHEIRRVLRPQGRLIGTVPANEDLSENTIFCPHCQATFHRWGHVTSFSDTRLKDLLSSTFQVRRIREKAFVDWKGRTPRRLLTGVARVFAYHCGLYRMGGNYFFCALNSIHA
jgi:SAM-dependent methyltransferase